MRVPVDYDPNHKYRIVYIGQGCGGYDVANTSTLQLFKETSGGTEEAIYVALDIPTDMANQDCYDNRDGPSSQEWEAFELFHTVVDSNYCVDNDRVYVSGYSTGGWLTNMWGCYFAGDGQHPWNGVPGRSLVRAASRARAAGNQRRRGRREATGATDALMSDARRRRRDVDGSRGGRRSTSWRARRLRRGQRAARRRHAHPADAGRQRKFAPEYHIRAQAGVSGGEPDNNPPCNGPIAAIWIHDLMDSNAYSANHDVALPRVLKMNGCYSDDSADEAPWHEDVMGKGVCVQYTDCPAAYPVVFCTTIGYGHADQHERAIPGFNALLQRAGNRTWPRTRRAPNPTASHLPHPPPLHPSAQRVR